MNDNWGMLGNEWAVDMLKQHVVREAVRHAYLFSGSPGLGRRTLALRFTQALHCPNPTSPAEPCRVCRVCQQIEAMQFPDLNIIQAEKEGGVLKVEQIRLVRRNLALTPYQGKYRVALFLRFQEANPNAANALLKTLEEAPAHAILVLTADNAEQLLPTIVSRCEILRLRTLTVEKLESALIARGAESEKARLLASLSTGRPGYALRLMQDAQALDFRCIRLDDLHKLLVASRLEKFTYAEALARNKETFRETLLLWLAYFRDVMLRTSKAGTPISNVDRASEIESLADKLTLSAARQLVAMLEGTIDRLERNVNARLLAEVLLLDMPKV